MALIQEDRKQGGYGHKIISSDAETTYMGGWMITLHAKMIEFCLCVLLWVCLWSLFTGPGPHQSYTVAPRRFLLL